MTDAALDTTRPAAFARPRRSYLGMILFQTFGRVGAWIGAGWLAVVAFCAVFAPFLANSHPIVMKTADGQLGWPLFAHLKPVDVVLPIVAFTAVVVALLPRLLLRWRMLMLLGVTVLATVGSFILIAPPRLVVLQRYRTMAEAGEIQWKVHTPIAFSPTDRQRERSQDVTRYQPPGTGSHLFGTEANGADVFSRMIHACRIAIAVGFIATGIALVIGVTLGGLMGYFSGIVDLLGMRLVEIFSAIPTFFLLLTLVAVMPPELNPYKLYVMMVIIGLTGWVGYARFTRAEFLKLRQQDFVQAAKACGLPLRSVLFRHMLPNGVTPVLVEASFGVAGAILYEATLSFLGLGLVDEPSWGQMLSQATSGTGKFNWWMATFPGMGIFLTVFAFNLVGEALRDAIDPHTQRSSQL